MNTPLFITDASFQVWYCKNTNISNTFASCYLLFSIHRFVICRKSSAWTSAVNCWLVSILQLSRVFGGFSSHWLLRMVPLRFQYSRVTLYTAGQLAHSPATSIHTTVLIVLPGHGCVNNGGTAVWTMGHGCVQVPGCVEGHPWYCRSWPEFNVCSSTPAFTIYQTTSLSFQ